MKTTSGIALLGLGLLAAAGCGGDKVNSVTPSYQSEYFITTTGFVTIDSVHIDDGTGAIQSVTHPNLGIIATFTPSQAPFSVQGTAWVRLQASAQVIFRESWSTRTTFGADSVVFKAGAVAESTTVLLPRHLVS